MNALSFFSTAVGVSAFWFAVLLGGQGISRIDRRVGFLVALSLAAWEFLAAFSYSADDLTSFVRLMTWSYVPYFLFHAASLHFVLVSWNRERSLFDPLVWAIYAVTGVVFAVAVSRPDYFSGFYRSGEYWHFVHDPTDPGFRLVAAHAGVFQLAQLFGVLRRGGDNTRRSRGRARILVVAILLVFAGTITEAVIAPAIVGRPGVGVQPILYLPWLLAITVVLQARRYRLPALFQGDREAIAKSEGIVIAYAAGTNAALAVSSGATSVFGADPPTLDRLESEAARQAIGLRLIRFEDPHHDNVLTLAIGAEKSVVADFAREYKLSDREREVLRLVSAGIANRAIADLLYISERTVKSHIGSILRKSGLRSRSQVISAVHRPTE